MNATTLIETCKALNIPIDNHESDLYIPVTETTQALVEQYEFRSNVKTFKSQIDGQLWYDIPFAYLPFWEARQDRSEPTWENQLWHARKMSDNDLAPHASVSVDNRHRCEDCFTCAALTVLEERNPQLKTTADKAARILDAMQGN